MGPCTIEVMDGCRPSTSPTGRRGRGRQPEEVRTHTPLDDPLRHQPRAHTPLTTHTQPQQCIFSVATGACSLCKFSRQSGELCTAVAALPITVGPSCLSPRTRSPVSVAVAPNTPPGSEAGVSGPCPSPRDPSPKVLRMGVSLQNYSATHGFQGCLDLLSLGFGHICFDFLGQGLH